MKKNAFELNGVVVFRFFLSFCLFQQKSSHILGEGQTKRWKMGYKFKILLLKNVFVEKLFTASWYKQSKCCCILRFFEYTLRNLIGCLLEYNGKLASPLFFVEYKYFLHSFIYRYTLHTYEVYWIVHVSQSITKSTVNVNNLFAHINIIIKRHKVKSKSLTEQRQRYNKISFI